MQDLREWYKIPALARKWQDKDITEDDIEHMIEIGKLNTVLRDSGYHLPLSVDSLKEHARALRLRGCNNFTTVFCDISFDGDEEMGLELVVMSEEVERAEAEYFTPTVKDIIAAETTVAPGRLTEKPEAYAARRRLEGALDKDIARELLDKGVYKNHVAYILAPNPNIKLESHYKKLPKILKG